MALKTEGKIPRRSKGSMQSMLMVEMSFPSTVDGFQERVIGIKEILRRVGWRAKEMARGRRGGKEGSATPRRVDLRSVA